MEKKPTTVARKHNHRPYAVYRQWHDTPDSMDVVEYFDTVYHAESFIRNQRKDTRYTWHIGTYN